MSRLSSILALVVILAWAGSLATCSHRAATNARNLCEAAHEEALVLATEAVGEAETELADTNNTITETRRETNAATERAVHEALNVIENAENSDARFDRWDVLERQLRDQADSSYSAAAEVYFASLGDGADPAGAVA